MSAEEDNKAIVRRFYEEVFNQGREEVIDEIISPDYIDYGHEPPGKGREGAKQDFRGATSVFSNTHYTIDELIAKGDSLQDSSASRVIVREESEVAEAIWQLLEQSVHIHPTYGEALPSLARLLYG